MARTCWCKNKYTNRLKSSNYLTISVQAPSTRDTLARSSQVAQKCIRRHNNALSCFIWFQFFGSFYVSSTCSSLTTTWLLLGQRFRPSQFTNRLSQASGCSLLLYLQSSFSGRAGIFSTLTIFFYPKSWQLAKCFFKKNAWKWSFYNTHEKFQIGKIDKKLIQHYWAVRTYYLAKNIWNLGVSVLNVTISGIPGLK